MNPLIELEKRIGTNFKKRDLLEEALTHRSYLNENSEYKYGNNERLEFLGDAVLELIVTDELIHRFPEKEEGDLTAYRAALVNTKMLAKVADEAGITEKIKVSKGEAKEFDKARGRESISADAVEAVIGAIYLDSGFAAAKKFIFDFVLPNINKILAVGAKDAKSLIQEIAQERFKVTPTYKVLKEIGPAHDRTFEVGLYFGGELKARGDRNSKQEAETSAAEKVLKDLKE